MKFKGLAWLFVILFGISTAFAADPPKPKHVIGMEKAKQIALKKAPGTITDSELEYEKKQWVYSFDIKGADQKTHEVLVNARTGKVVSASIETAADAATEKKEDAKATQTAK